MALRRGDGAVVLSAPIVRRAVDDVVRELASRSNFKELFFHETHSFADIVLHNVVIRLNEQDEGPRLKNDVFGDAFIEALPDAMIKIGMEPTALTQAVGAPRDGARGRAAPAPQGHGEGHGAPGPLRQQAGARRRRAHLPQAVLGVKDWCEAKCGIKL